MLQYRATTSAPAACPRRRLLAAVIGAGGLASLLITGVVLSVADLARTTPGAATDHSEHPSTTTPPPLAPTIRAVSPAVARARDALAARPMPDTGTGDAYGRPDLSTADPGAPILLPRARGTGGWGVQTGYPQTPEGAIAQLAAIDAAALRSASLAGARAVIREWAAPGGPTARSWSGVRAMKSLLESTGVASDGTARLDVVATPRMGLIKGVVEDDFVVACVDFTVDITFGGTSRTVAVDCQRLVWDGRRWLIGPGREPAKGVSVWPDTDAAIDAGYRDLLVTPAPEASRG
jgi:hypothetical protein